MNKSIGALAVTFLLGVAPSYATDVKAGDLTIESPWARATPKGAEVAGAYLTIRNDGAAPDRLTGGSADFGDFELHEMSNAGGVMKMRELKDGLAIPAHGSVKLAPSGYHIMFTELKHPLAKGQTVKVTLTFEHAGAVTVDFAVRGIGASGPEDGMGGMKM